MEQMEVTTEKPKKKAQSKATLLRSKKEAELWFAPYRISCIYSYSAIQCLYSCEKAAGTASIVSTNVHLAVHQGVHAVAVLLLLLSPSKRQIKETEGEPPHEIGSYGILVTAP